MPSHQFFISSNEPAPVASSAYYNCFRLALVDSSLMSGTEATVNIAIASGSPCVVPSLERITLS